jgi:hypothetical protein
MIRNGNSISSGMTSRGHDDALVREAGITRTLVEGKCCFVYLPRVESSL